MDLVSILEREKGAEVEMDIRKAGENKFPYLISNSNRIPKQRKLWHRNPRNPSNSRPTMNPNPNKQLLLNLIAHIHLPDCLNKPQRTINDFRSVLFKVSVVRVETADDLIGVANGFRLVNVGVVVKDGVESGVQAVQKGYDLLGVGFGSQVGELDYVAMIMKRLA